MRRIILVLLCIALTLLVLVSCGDKQDAETNPITPEIVEVLPSEPCEHDWELTAFVTEISDMPYAARFTCDKCGGIKTDSFDYTDIEIPLVSIEGDLSLFVTESGDVDRELKIPVVFSYKSKSLSFDSDATLKLQGKSSVTDPKKNYSVNLIESESGKKKKVAFKDEWGEGNKYVLKANFSEPSAVRNIALSSLYGQMAHGRNLADHYTYLANCGAVDGYPVLLYVNGQYQGLYNWVIRKDKWLFGMGDDAAGEAVLEGSDVDALLSAEGVVMLPDGMRSDKSWEEEYVNENYGEKGWAEASFNRMLFAIRDADGSVLREKIAEYVEVERTIDVMLFNCVFGATDSISGNQVWCTFDGKKWAPVPYDLDRTLGRDGNCLTEADESISETIEQNVLYEKIVTAYFDEISERYRALRESLFTVDYVMSVVCDKLRGVDDRYFLAELEKWPDAPWLECEGSEEITGFEAELKFIETYLEARFACCDAYFGK